MKRLIKKTYDYIVNNKIFIVLAAVSAVVFILALVQNYLTSYASDDYRYCFVYDTYLPDENTRRVKNIFDVIVSMINHWKMCNGRIVAHGLLQTALISDLVFGKTFFNVLNSAVYVLLGILIYKHATYNKAKSGLLFVLIYVMMWFFLPQYGTTVLWASGAANYLWCTVIMMVYLLPYRMYMVNGENVFKDSWRNCLLMGVLGLFSGCTNENTGGALALMCIAFVVIFKIKKIKIPKWSLSGIAAVIIGALILVIAPSNRRISSKTDLAGLLERGENILKISSELIFPICAVMIVLLIFVWATNINRYSNRSEDEPNNTKDFEWLTPIVYIIGAVATIAVLVFAALQPPRAFFFGICLLITAAAYFFTEIRLSVLGRHVCAVIAVLLIIVNLVSYYSVYEKLSEIYEIIEAREEIFNTAVEKGEKAAKVKIITLTDFEYSCFDTVRDFSTDSNDWMNCWVAEYYGLEKVNAEH